MPSLNAPVLTVDVGLIHKVDTRNVENLFSMWTVFSRCSGSLEEGRRLENLSWRLWNRETFCCDPISEANSTTPAISIAARTTEGRYEVPSLSGSVDSFADEEALEFESDHTSTSSTSAPLDISHPQIRRHDSVNSRSRGRERHITPDDLEKMVITIKEKKDLEPITLNIQPYSPPTAITISSPLPEEIEQESESAALNSKSISPEATSHVMIPSISSNASGNSERSTTSVVRGFSPSHISSSYRSIPLLSAPSSITEADIAATTTSHAPESKKKVQMFALGGSSGDDSLSEQAHSVETTQAAIKKNPMFSFGASSNEDESSLPRQMQKPQSALASNLQRSLTQKKQTSFQEEVATRTLDEQHYSDDVFETDEEDVDESAIDDDDDSSDWEDSAEESGNVSIDDDIFIKRVPSRPNLTSRPSLITTLLHQSERANALAAAASRSTPALQRSRTTSPNGPSLAASVESDDGSTLMMKKSGLRPIPEITRTGSGPQQIIQPTSNPGYHQLALSPRTTRRNMLATELTVSLRQHLLWERQQKSQTFNAAIKRRHTSHDVANLKQYPEKVHMGTEDSQNKDTWNQYFGGAGEYHSKGW